MDACRRRRSRAPSEGAERNHRYGPLFPLRSHQNREGDPRQTGAGARAAATTAEASRTSASQRGNRAQEAAAKRRKIAIGPADAAKVSSELIVWCSVRVAPRMTNTRRMGGKVERQ